MKPSEAQQSYDEELKSLEFSYFKHLSPWIQQIKPEAKTFEFEGYQEGDDEGGSYCCFSSLFIDDSDLKELVMEMSEEKIRELFEISSYYKNGALDDEDDKWDAVRDNLSFPEFVYDHGKLHIVNA